MAETAAQRCIREAVSTVNSRRLKDSVPPAPAYRPLPRPSGPPAVVPAPEPSIGEIGRAAVRLRSGDASCKELLEDSLLALERDNPRLNAVSLTTEERAREQVLGLDEELASGRTRGPLHGIPISVSDLIHVASVTTRAGSRSFQVVPDSDATAAALLRRSGAVLLGKAATSEFGLGAAAPSTLNPAAAGGAGGSSAGPAAAVAAGMGLGSLASDTRGSARVSAALCGVVGFKPTLGTVPTDGLLQVSWSMDHVGLLARSVPDAALLLDELAGTRLFSFAGSDPGNLRIGVPPDGTTDVDYGVLGAFQTALQRLRRIAGEVVDVLRPATLDFSNSSAAGLVVSRSEAAAYHRRLGVDRSKLRPEIREQLEAADRITAVEYLDAQRLRSSLAEAMLKVFEHVDVLALPTSLVPAPPIDDADDYLVVLCRNTVPWSFIGYPAISVPCGRTAAGFPVGVQLVAPPNEEASLVALGSAFEAAR
ncbi:MAG TPA: amidase [Actinomycetota bacterium]|nr:amidase [Actinomycetota bacterium]